jgi:hypothetical protein
MTSTKWPCCDALLQRLRSSQDDATPSRWLRYENGSAPRRQSPGRWIGTTMDGEQVRDCFELWCRLLTGVGAAGVFCCRRRCPLRQFLSASTGPFQTENVPPRRPPSWVPSWSLPSGWDVFVRQLFQQPTGLVFARVRAALRRRVGFVLALLWCCFWFAPALWWHRIRQWFVHFVLALLWQRLLFAPAILWRRLELSLGLPRRHLDFHPHPAFSCAQGTS